MRTRLVILSLLAVVALATTSALIAYRLGFRHGGVAERACWTLDSAPAEAWVHGEITARRDTKKHPFLKSMLVLRGDRSVNSIPAKVEF
jgi:hypothetical protein